MKLSSHERAIVSYAHLQAHLSPRDIAKKTHLTESTVRRLLHKLLHDAVIVPCPYINVYPLGFAQFGIFFSLLGDSAKWRASLERYLQESEEVSWICEVGGDFTYGISLCAPDVFWVRSFLAELAIRFKAIFYEKEIAIRTRLTDFRLKYLTTEEYEVSEISWGVSRNRVKIEQLDHMILSAMSSSKTFSLSALARTIGVPWSTIKYRIERLTAENILVRQTYLVDSGRFGAQSFLLLVYARGLAENFREDLLQFCREHPNVSFLVECLGSWDFEIGVECEESKVVGTLIRSLNERLGHHINAIKSLPVFGYSKVSMYPFTSFSSIQKRIPHSVVGRF